MTESKDEQMEILNNFALEQCMEVSLIPVDGGGMEGPALVSPASSSGSLEGRPGGQSDCDPGVDDAEDALLVPAADPRQATAVEDQVEGTIKSGKAKVSRVLISASASKDNLVLPPYASTRKVCIGHQQAPRREDPLVEGSLNLPLSLEAKEGGGGPQDNTLKVFPSAQGSFLDGKAGVSYQGQQASVRGERMSPRGFRTIL
eukprot:Gb_18415 [translate_table: standard]